MLQSGFARQVKDCLERTGLPPHSLCLELTESLFLGKTLNSVRTVLDEIHALGVMLALDDFGTGYSSLAYLSQLPFDKLKIDRSFVRQAHTSARRSEVLRSIVEMAHALGMKVVAEGAEDGEEVALLENLHADEVQGYAIARPENADAVMKTVAYVESESGSALVSSAG